MPVAIIAQHVVLVNMRDFDITEQKLLRRCLDDARVVGKALPALDASLGKGCREGKHKAQRCLAPWQFGRPQSPWAWARTGLRRG